MSTQVFLASTGFGLATLAAALDDGLFPATGRRVLVTSNNAAVPEVSPEITDVAGMTGLLERFDVVHSYNAMVAPQHPSRWRPRAQDLPIWQRHLQASWGLDGAGLRLVVESLQVPPALVLAQAFPDARIDVYGDGLMSYGPTRVALPTTVASRIERLMHLDLLPDVPPLLLAEFDVPATIISTDAFAKVVAGLEPVPGLPVGDPRGTAILLGQYLSVNGFLSPAEEQQLHLDMVQGAVEAGFNNLVFKPHPSAPEPISRPLVLQARSLGAELTICTEAALAEAWFRSEQVGLVVGCFSTALFTAASLYQLPVARVGTRLLLNRLRPYSNSNRIPLTVVDAAVPDLADCAPGAMERLAPLTGQPLTELVRVVGYCMQPGLHADLRPEVRTWLTAHGRSQRHYFTRRRLTELNLPGRIPRRRHPAKQALRSALGSAAYGRLGKIWRRLRSGSNRATPSQTPSRPTKHTRPVRRR